MPPSRKSEKKEQWVLKGDIGRAVRQQAAYFRDLPNVLLEYIWNGLDNPAEGEPRVRVEVHFENWSRKDKRRIVITDTGSGMSADEVQDRFLTLFRENEQRRKHKWARGQFGTGKVAAFGIAALLTLRTVKDGKRTIVRLNLEDCQPGIEYLPVETIEEDRPCSESHGTTVLIERLQPRQFNVKAARRRVENDLRRALQAHDVYFDGNLLTWQPPPTHEQWSFPSPPEDHGLYGDVTFTIRDAGEKLEDLVGGFGVFTHTALRELSYVGFEGSATASRLWGEVAIDPNLLDNPDDNPPAATNARDNRLNPENHRVERLHRWMRQCVQDVLNILEKKIEARMEERQRKKIARLQRDIESILDSDWRVRQRDIRSALAHGGSAVTVAAQRTSRVVATPGEVGVLSNEGPVAVSEDPMAAGLVVPVTEPGNAVDGSLPMTPMLAHGDGTASDPGTSGGVAGDQSGERQPSSGPNPGENPQSRDETPRTPLEPTAQSMGDAPVAASETPARDDAPESASKRRQDRALQDGDGIGEGGFSVQCRPFGTDSWRSMYSPSERMILINLDYPQVKAASDYEGGIDGPFFKALMYDIAFHEYAGALARYLAQNDHPDVSDPENTVIFMTRTLNDLCVHAAGLFARPNANAVDPDEPLDENGR